MTKLKTAPHGLSLQFVTAEAADVQWSEIGGGTFEAWSVIMPRPTYGDVAEYDAEMFAGGEDETPRDPAAVLTDDDYDTFSGSDAQCDWQGQFEPMMNYAWPVEFAYELPHDAEGVATLFREFAPNCVLVEFGEGSNPFGDSYSSDTPEYGIALKGGGMDLSDDLAAAYLCCGCVPPERILSGLSGVMSARDRDRLPIAEAFERAADWFANRAERLTKEAARLAAKA